MSRSKPPKPPLDPDDEAVWLEVQKHVKPLKRKNTPIEPAVAERSKAIAAAQLARERPKAPPAVKASETRGSLQYKSTRKLGKLDVQARLDLHGYQQEAAYRTLVSFVQRSAMRGCKNLLVITGKGRVGATPEETRPSVLRQMLPRWLEETELRPYIHFYTQAHDEHGGTGAFYVVLRRLKD